MIGGLFTFSFFIFVQFSTSFNHPWLSSFLPSFPLFSSISSAIQGWAIAHFENVRSLFLKCDLKLAQSHFWKEWQKVRSHNCTFEKCDRKCDRPIALLKSAKMCDVWMYECAIAKPYLKFNLPIFPVISPCFKILNFFTKIFNQTVLVFLYKLT